MRASDTTRGPGPRPGAASLGLDDRDDAALAGRPVNSTVPARVAKIVWSRPRPVPSPGRKRVPRWRTMISPPADLLAREDLHAEHLRVRIAAVAARAESLLVRHLPSPPSSSKSCVAAGFFAAGFFAAGLRAVALLGLAAGFLAAGLLAAGFFAGAPSRRFAADFAAAGFAVVASSPRPLRPSSPPRFGLRPRPSGSPPACGSAASPPSPRAGSARSGGRRACGSPSWPGT